MKPLRLVHSLVVGALVVAVATVGIGATASSAAPRELGGIMWSDTKGTSQSLLSVYTAKGCAAEAERVSGIAYGKGFPTKGQVLVAPSTLLLSATRPMQLPLSNAFIVYAERNSTALDGKYEIKVLCTDRFGVNTLGEFSTTMKWDTPGNSLKNVEKATFVAKNTATVDPTQAELPQPDEVVVPQPSGSGAPQGTTAPSAPATAGGGAAGGGTGAAPDGSSADTSSPAPNSGVGPTPGGSADSPAPQAGDPAVTGTGTAAADENGSTVAILLILVLAVLAIGLLAWWLLGRREGTA